MGKDELTMKKALTRIVLTAALMAVIGVAVSSAQEREYEDYAYNPRVDRYLDAEVWTGHSDGDYYIGDGVVINFRVSRDAFVAIYSVDTRGRVNLLFPADPMQDNFVYGGVTHSIPSVDDDYDLVVNGPEGVEYLQILASRDRFPIPNWYHNSGLLYNGDDIYGYMDYLNSKHFVRYGGQQFAYDRAVIFVNEWEPYYYQPVYYPVYPSWAVAGNVYLDYWPGSSVYINGIFWGCTPLYIPRLVVGWHTITIYDHYGYCWESDVHISHYNTVVLNDRVIKTSASVNSKFAKVAKVGYRDPVKNGYPDFSTKSIKSGAIGPLSKTGNVAVTPQAGKRTPASSGKSVGYTNLPKKYTRGSTDMVKTTRGWEVDGASASYGADKGYKSSRSTGVFRGSSGTNAKDYSGSAVRKGYTGSNSKGSSSGSGYYQKKSGSSGGKTWTGSRHSSGSKSSGGTYKSGSSSSKSSGSYRSSGSSKSSGSSSRGVSKGSSKSSGSKSGSTYKGSGGSKSSGGSSKSSGSSGSSGKSSGGSKSKK
jgi:hypothetical protein